MLVEDELHDIEFTQYAFDRGDLVHELAVCQTGRAAIEHVRDTLNTELFPDLVLLDVNLPDMMGIDVVDEMRAIAYVPVIMLSTSSYNLDVVTSYGASANAYVQKPARLAGFESLVRSIELFWFSEALLPATLDRVEFEKRS